MSLIEHLEKLRHFYKVSQHRSISEAAELSGFSQAGLSKSISALEQVLGKPLFLRTGQGLVLTKEGELTLAVTKTILSEANTLEISLRSLHATKIPEKLKIGMYDSIAVYFFSDLISYLKALYKGVKIELLVDTSSNLSTAIKDGTVDLCIGVNLNSTSPPKSEFFMLFEDNYSFYVSPKADDINPSSILILHPYATDMDHIPTEKHLYNLISTNGAHRVFNFETLKTLTVQGLGIGVLPTQVAKPLIAQRQLVQITMPKAKNAFGRHNIGFLAAEKFLSRHRDFANDIYRLGERWAKL